MLLARGAAGGRGFHVAVIHRDREGIRRQATPGVQPPGDSGHRNRIIVPANVSALAGQGSTIGKAMVHQNAETLAVEPSHSREAACVVESGCGGGLQRARQDNLSFTHDGPILDQCSGFQKDSRKPIPDGQARRPVPLATLF
jgi:hypothetical protein